MTGKLKAEKAELSLLVPIGCANCTGVSCVAETVCYGTNCVTIGIPCCKTCPANKRKIAM